jgi:poly-gamma-glutamate capsule biosynthesis protein CapA/YwtB (metallophosphatase superfamily)
MRDVTLFVCGDVMTGRGIDQILPCPSAPDLFEPSIHDARGYVALAEKKSGPIPRAVSLDYVWGDALDELARVAPAARIINLETSITRSDDAQPWKQIHYRMHPANVGCLVEAGVDVCVLSNNHVLDWGEGGLIETLDVLAKASIQVAGAGRSAEQAARPAVVPVHGGGRILVLGFGHESSGVAPSWAATNRDPGVSYLDDLSEESARAIGERVRRLRRPGDVVVASIHWGSNWGYEVPDTHVRFAHALVDGGVDLVHGHSSHHVRPIEVYRRRLILYGCGDFLSDYEGIRGHEAYRGELGVMYFPTLDAATGELRALRMVPMHTRRMRLERAVPGEVAWLADTLTRIGSAYGTTAVASDDGALALARETA